MCYWVSQNQCLLQSLPCESVLEILTTVPAARRDLLTCARGCVQAACNGELYLEYVAKVALIQDPLETSDAYQKRINAYVDNHRALPDKKFPE